MLSSHNDQALPVPSTSAMTQSVLPPYNQPSSSTTPETGNGTTGAKKKPAPKRRRTGDAASDSADSSAHPVRTREGPKKKKANRACFHCQKAHLTCDDTRPCQRCVKRGMADNCTEGHRKKAKYLLDEEELDALKRSKSGESSKSTESAPAPAPDSQPEFAQAEPVFQPYIPPGTYVPQAEGPTLEYTILSAILGGSPDAESPSTSVPQNNGQSSQGSSYPAAPTNLVTATWPGEPQYAGANSSSAAGVSADGYPGPVPGPSSYGAADYNSPTSAGFVAPSQFTQQTSDAMAGPSTNGHGEYPYGEYAAGSSSQNQAQASVAQYGPMQILNGADPASPTGYMRLARGLHPASRTERPAWSSMPDAGGLNAMSSAAAAVYQSVTKPYDYTEGYHFLMKHIPRRFEKNDILRIVRALAIFRPSLIALQMPLSEEDEIFVEKCFQRSLIELDKLVSFSGTPTVAWRRTGEICLVGPEFCLLTGWEKEELVGRRKYIYELFENQSVVEYWENFANHAFENTTQSVYAHCVLLKPSGAPVPCTFCFSIRRDIMDLPSLVIGQWLPLL